MHKIIVRIAGVWLMCGIHASHGMEICFVACMLQECYGFMEERINIYIRLWVIVVEWCLLSTIFACWNENFEATFYRMSLACTRIHTHSVGVYLPVNVYRSLSFMSSTSMQTHSNMSKSLFSHVNLITLHFLFFSLAHHVLVLQLYTAFWYSLVEMDI